MIAFIEGQLIERTASFAIICTGGIGYQVLMSSHSLTALPDVGQNVKVVTYMQVSDSGIVLFGFMEKTEEELFRSLITVSGIGPKMALAALSCYKPAELMTAITAQDVKAVSKIPGVGKKTASRIILELKDALMSEGVEPAALSSDETSVPSLEGATEALLSMGFTLTEAQTALKGAPENADEGALLQYALKRLA